MVRYQGRSSAPFRLQLFIKLFTIKRVYPTYKWVRIMDITTMLANVFMNWQMGLITPKEYFCQRAEIKGAWYLGIAYLIPSWAYDLYVKIR